MKGKNILFVARIGLPPLRSLIEPMLDSRSEFKDIQILYGARSPQTSLHGSLEGMGKNSGDPVHDVRGSGSAWTGNVGVVTTLFPRRAHDADACFRVRTAVMIRSSSWTLGRGSHRRILSPPRKIHEVRRGKVRTLRGRHKYICLDARCFRTRT